VTCIFNRRATMTGISSTRSWTALIFVAMPREYYNFQNRENTRANRQLRGKLISKLAADDPSLNEAYQEAKRIAEAEAGFVIRSGRFQYGASGDTNTYPLFTELSANVIGERGRVGIIVKTGILADFSMKDFFSYLVETGRFASAFDFSNKKLIFPAVVANERFTLLTLCGAAITQRAIQISILNEDVSDLFRPGRTWELSRADISAINPNTKTCPLFQTARDAALVSGIYQRHSVLTREGAGSEVNEWGSIYFRMFDMTNDSGFFRDQETLQDESNYTPNSRWNTRQGEYLALLEGKLFDLFDHRHGTFDGVPRTNRFGIKAEPNHPSLEQRINPSFQCLPRYWVPKGEVDSRFNQRLGFVPSGILTFRDVCRTHTDLRTVRAAICPPLGAGNKAPLLIFPGLGKQEHAIRSALLCANLASYAVDYVARQKFAGGSLNRFILIQFPIVSLSRFKMPLAWSGGAQTLRNWVLLRVMELSYTAHDLRGFAEDCGYTGDPFHWDEERRFLLRCELDAAFFHLYGINRDDVDYILETFPIVKRKDESARGEYRTKRVILEIYDEMKRAMDMGAAYLTRLDPPPANGWTPPEIEENGEKRGWGEGEKSGLTFADFQLCQEDEQPQPGLFDKAD
ncbi:MAG: hypothetical protein J2P21_32055, partial [Chloracidobacterium sp.]|nr:hypothetical protein [Chloracidobacterium sp.]